MYEASAVAEASNSEMFEGFDEEINENEAKITGKAISLGGRKYKTTPRRSLATTVTKGDSSLLPKEARLSVMSEEEQPKSIERKVEEPDVVPKEIVKNKDVNEEDVTGKEQLQSVHAEKSEASDESQVDLRSKRYEELQERRRKMEAENKRRKELLAKAIADR